MKIIWKAVLPALALLILEISPLSARTVKPESGDAVGGSKSAPKSKEPRMNPAVQQTLWHRVLQRYQDAKKKGGGVSKEFRKRIERLYKQAKEAGEDVPSDVTEWLKTDIENMTRWHYHIETLKSLENKTLDKKLDALGRERWECFQVVRDGTQWRLFFKRRKRSYLKMIPVRQLLEFGPDGGGQ